MPGLHGWVPANTCWLVGLVGHPQRRRNYYFYSPSRRRRRRKRKKVSTSTSFSLCGRTVSFCLSSSSSKVSTAAVAILLIRTTTKRREREWRGLLLSPNLRIHIGDIPQYCIAIVPRCKFGKLSNLAPSSSSSVELPVACLRDPTSSLFFPFLSSPWPIIYSGVRAKEEAVGGGDLWGSKKGKGGRHCALGARRRRRRVMPPPLFFSRRKRERGKMACSFIHAPLVKIKEGKGEYECVYSCFFSYYLCNNRELPYLPLRHCRASNSLGC